MRNITAPLSLSGLWGALAASAGFGQWESHFFFGFFFDPTCSNEVKVYITTHRERERERKVNGEREKRERELSLYSLKTRLVGCSHKREKFWREKKSKPIMKGYYDRVT